MRKGLAVSILLAIAGVAASHADDGLSFNFKAKRLSISTGDKELSYASRLLAVDPKWERKRMDLYGSKFAEQTSNENGARKVSYKSTDSSYPFNLKEYSAETGPAGLTIRVDGALSEQLPTIVEHSVMAIPPSALDGASFSAVLENGATVNGTVGVPADKIIIPPFSKASFATPYGTLSITVQEGPAISLVDRRTRMFESHQCLWLGALETPVSMSKPFRHTILIAFDKTQKDPGPRILPSFPLSSDAIEKQEPLPPMPLLTTPKEQADLPGVFYVPQANDALCVKAGAKGADASRLERAASRILVNELRLPLKPAADMGNAKGVEVRVCDDKDIPETADGYTLSIDAQGAVVKAKTPRAAFYGLQTLKFLFRDGKFAGTKIKDWPDFQTRGLHLLADDHALQLHGDLIRKVMAPLKMNHIVYEIEYVKWDSLKGLHRTWGMSKEDLRKLKEIADENFIEITPLLQTLGHCEWLFVDGKNKDWVEDVNCHYAYDTSKPEVYALMAKTIDEVFELFKPRYLHIGHDEIRNNGKYPARSYNVEKGVLKLFTDDILWYHRYAAERGVKLMMWHDLLVPRDETFNGKGVGNGGGVERTVEARDKLPKDIVIVDWQYLGTPAYPEMDVLKKLGFEVMGATWSEDDRNCIEKFSVYAKGRATGMIETTWTTYNGNETALLTSDKYRQIAAYVKSGARFWNADAANNWSENCMLARMLGCDKGRNASAGKGKLIDISAQANISFSQASNPFRFNDTFGLDTLPQEPSRLAGVMFQIASREGCPAAVTTSSKKLAAFPNAVEMPVQSKAKRLYFLHTSMAFVADGTLVGEYIVKYKDGSVASIPVKAGQEIATPLSQADNIYLQNLPQHKWTDKGRDLRIFCLRWTNPQPGKEIASVTLRSAGTQSSTFLLALSLAE